MYLDFAIIQRIKGRVWTMITIINDTFKPFQAAVETTTQEKKMKNKRMTVGYGKMKFDTFFDEKDVEKVAATITGTNHKSAKFVNSHTRLYQSNKEHLPILVASKINSNSANFLFAAQKLNETERIVRVVYDGVFALARDFVKGKHLALVASFRTDRPTSMTVVTVDGDKVYETTYTCTKSEEKVTKTVTEFETAKYTRFDTTKRGIIKPYRLLIPTHLVFTEKQYVNQAEAVCNKNFTIVPVTNTLELEEFITKYKGFGFTAASLFLDESKDEPISGITQTYLKKLQTNFRCVHLVHDNGYTVDKSVKPDPRKKSQQQRRPQGQRKQAPNKKVNNNRAKETGGAK